MIWQSLSPPATRYWLSPELPDHTSNSLSLYPQLNSSVFPQSSLCSFPSSEHSRTITYLINPPRNLGLTPSYLHRHHSSFPFYHLNMPKVCSFFPSECPTAQVDATNTAHLDSRISHVAPQPLSHTRHKWDIVTPVLLWLFSNLLFLEETPSFSPGEGVCHETLSSGTAGPPSFLALPFSQGPALSPSAPPSGTVLAQEDLLSYTSLYSNPGLEFLANCFTYPYKSKVDKKDFRCWARLLIWGFCTSNLQVHVLMILSS